MNPKFFQTIPKWCVGIILIIGSAFDAAAVVSAFEKYPYLTAVFVIIKSMIIKFDKLYRGVGDQIDK